MPDAHNYGDGLHPVPADAAAVSTDAAPDSGELVRKWCLKLLEEGQLIDLMSARDLALQMLAITDVPDSTGRSTNPRRRVRRRRS